MQIIEKSLYKEPIWSLKKPGNRGLKTRFKKTFDFILYTQINRNEIRQFISFRVENFSATHSEFSPITVNYTELSIYIFKLGNEIIICTLFLLPALHL
jgi:hypothetical protein